MTTTPRRLRALATSATLFALSACSSDETGAEDHTPATVKVLANGTELTQPYLIALGTATRIQLKFYNAANEDLDDVESEHYGRLTFTPNTIVTVAPVTEHHFQFDVTGLAIGAGKLTIGYGHDTAADEHEFPNLDVTVVAVGSIR